LRLGEDFYKQDAVTVAENLVGKLLVRKLKGEKVECRIVETEAYAGPEDKASHAYQNKKTDRTEVMFNSGGCVYVYLIYGIHNCFNIVTNEKGKPEAVFVRAVEPLSGIEIIKEKRDIKSKQVEEFTNGPGKLSQALDINKELNGYDLVSGDEIYLKTDDNNPEYQVISGKRINIDYAEEYREKLWRFFIKGNPFVSV